MSKVELIALENFPLVEPGEDLYALIQASLTRNQLTLQNNDVLVLAQKIVSKSENRYVDLNTLTPSKAALALAHQADKDPRQMEALLSESKEVLKTRPGVVIVEHNNGYVHANAGIDQSNIKQQEGKELLLLLPKDSDASAQSLYESLQKNTGLTIPVVINDSFGRPFRNGTCGVCIGSAGFEVIDDKIGEKDLFGNILKVTQAAVADEIAAAASLLMGQADEGLPVVLVRGLNLKKSTSNSAPLLRDKEKDLFRQ